MSSNDGNCQGGGQVLVNCYAGTSRQVTIEMIKKNTNYKNKQETQVSRQVTIEMIKKNTNYKNKQEIQVSGQVTIKIILKKLMKYKKNM